MYLEIESTGPEERMQVQVRFSVQGATVLQRLFELITLHKDTRCSVPVGVILTEDAVPVIGYQIFRQKKLVYEGTWEKKPEEVIQSRTIAAEDRLVEELRKPAPDMRTVMECEESLRPDTFVAVVNKIAPRLSSRVFLAACERCHVPKQLCKLLDQQFADGAQSDRTEEETRALAMLRRAEVQLTLERTLERPWTTVNQRVLPMVEIHPLIRSRALAKTENLSLQVTELLHAQTVHAFISRNAFDRLQVFTVALLLDDFQMQDALYAIPEVKSGLERLPRFAQVHEYYLCCLGGKGSYDGHEQFNTFSAESQAKYGKVTEQVVVNSAYVEDQVLCVYADDLGAVSVRGCESEEEACLVSTPISCEQRGDHLEVDLRAEKAKVMCVMYPGKVLFVKNEHN